MAPAAVFILALVIYTGFAIPTRDMHPWFRWLNYINPVGYAFEALMINEVCPLPRFPWATSSHP
jgi:ABC-type multidrug transport system permease subunit